MERCMACMDLLPLNCEVCPHCGYDLLLAEQPEFALPLGARLHGGKYVVGRVLGQGGFGITYIGLDEALEMKVAIKEYYPMELASRTIGGPTLVWHSSVTDRQAGRESFVKEARKMAKIAFYMQRLNIRLSYRLPCVLSSNMVWGYKQTPEFRGCVS